MRTSSRLIALVVLSLASIQIVGCGGTGSPANNSNTGGSTTSTTSSTSSSVSITTTSLPGATVGTPYNSTLASKGGTAPLTWSISAGALPAGLSLASSTGAITGTPTGPASATAVSFTVKVTDSSSPASSATTQLSILVSTSGPLTLTPGSVTLTAGTVGTEYTQTFLASGGTPPYNFGIGGSNPLPLGLTGATTGGGGTFTISGVPSAACNACTFQVQVTDSATTQGVYTDNLTLTINPIALSCGPGGDESLLTGQYAMLLQGFDNGSTPEPAEASGVLFLDGAGNVGSTSTLFSNNAATTSGPVQYQGVIGSYLVRSDHRGCMAVVTPSGTQHYDFSLGSISGSIASSGHIVDADATGPFTSGVLLAQDTSAFASIAGNFAFAMSSPQSTTSVNGPKLGMAGVLTLNSTGSITAGTVDVNVGGVLNGGTAGPLTIGAGGTFFVNTYNGAMGILFPVTVNDVTLNIQFAGIVVSANQILLMAGTTQNDTTGYFGAGEALLQTSTPFSNASLSGTSVLATTALASTTPVSTLGTITSANDGTYTFSGWQNSGGSIAAENPAAGTVAIGTTTGRSVVSGAENPILWLVGTNEGFYLGTDNTVQTGFFQPVTPSSTLATGTSYSIGTVDPQVHGGDLQTGVETFNGSTVSQTTDDNTAGTVTAGNAVGPLTYSVNGAAGATCTVGASSGGCQVLIYVISPTQAIQMNLLNSSGTAETTPTIEPANQ